MRNSIFYQTQKVKYLSGQASGTFTQEIDLESGYNKITGVCLYQATGGGIPIYRLGLQSKDGVEWTQVAHKSDYEGSTNVAPADRYKPLNIEIGAGAKAKLVIELPANLTTDLEFDLVYRLEKVNC